jgi:hypothetical protein
MVVRLAWGERVARIQVTRACVWVVVMGVSMRAADVEEWMRVQEMGDQRWVRPLGSLKGMVGETWTEARRGEDMVEFYLKVWDWI